MPGSFPFFGPDDMARPRTPSITCYAVRRLETAVIATTCAARILDGSVDDLRCRPELQHTLEGKARWGIEYEHLRTVGDHDVTCPRDRFVRRLEPFPRIDLDAVRERCVRRPAPDLGIPRIAARAKPDDPVAPPRRPISVLEVDGEGHAVLGKGTCHRNAVIAVCATSTQFSPSTMYAVSIADNG